ncbi:MAG TPA: permease-like cell division protein FtsX [Burkholderiales bacterium]|nr:permease-like cell division protein FtsX [Burkholderiales bacterium]
MMRWVHPHLRALQDAFRRLLREPVGTLLSALAIALVVCLPLALYVTVRYLEDLPARMSVSPQVTLFLQHAASQEQAAAVERRLRERQDVRAVHFVGREAALAELAKKIGVSDLLDSSAENPLPDAFVVQVDGDNPDALERVRDETARWPGVEYVQADGEWVRRLDSLLVVGRTLTVLLAGLLLAGVAAISFNTIRLQILQRQAEIEVTSLLGGTAVHIRRPFVYFGALQGLLAGLTGALLFVAASLYAGPALDQLGRLYGTRPFASLLSWREVVFVSAACAILGATGAALSVRQYLRVIRE